MTTQLVTPPARPSPANAFAERCAHFKLLPWQFDARACLQGSPDLSSPLAALLTTEIFQELLQQAAQRMTLAPTCQPAEIARGCWVIPIPLQRRGRRTGLVLAVGFEPAFLNSPLLQTLAAAAGMPPEVVQAAVAPLTRDLRHSVADLMESLRWMHADLALATTNLRTLNDLSSKLVQSYEDVNLLFRLSRVLNFVKEPVQLINLVLAQIQQVLPFTWVAVRFHPARAAVPALGQGLLLHGDLPCSKELLERSALEMIEVWSTDQWTKIITPATHPLASVLGCEVLVEPITHDEHVVGVLFAGNKIGSDPDLTSSEMQLVDAIADFVGVFHENIARFSEQRALVLGSLQALSTAIEAKDPYTCGHSERVSLLAEQMAKAMGLPEKTVEQYRIAGLVHDIGKIGVPELILCKTGRLTDDEFAQIKRHPVTGHEILKGIPPMTAVLPGVLHHHERWDGGGYPDGLAGPDIPLIARVIAIADTFDAMSSRRSYRASLPREAVLAELRRNVGTQFDAALIEPFLALDFTECDAILARTRAQ